MSGSKRKDEELNEAGPSPGSSASPRNNLRSQVGDGSDDSEMDYGSLGKRIKQPNVNVLWNYGAVKLESNPLHYNPIVEVKEEPVFYENGDANKDKAEQTQAKKSSAKESKDEKAADVLLIDDDNFLSIPSDFHVDFELRAEEEKIATLEALKDRISGLGTISNVTISSESDLNLYIELQILGEQVKSIKINLWHSEQSPLDLELIVKRCPKLNLLEVKRPTPTNLACYNPETCKMNSPDHSKNNNLSKIIISKVVIEVCRCSCSILFYENFVKSGILVNDLTILLFSGSKNETEITHVTEEILGSSKDTLHCLTLQSGSGLEGLKIPVMPNLDTLALVWFSRDIIDWSFQFSKHLPKLKTVSLDLLVNKKMNTAFGLVGPAPSVKILHVTTSSRFELYADIFQVFSEIEELSIPYEKELSSVWKYSKKLKRLILSDDLGSAWGVIGTLVNLTGLKKKNAQQLWNSATNFDSHKINRLGPSIVELEDLEELSLKHFCLPEETMLKFMSIFKTVAWKFMQKLRVVNFEDRNGTIRSYAT